MRGGVKRFAKQWATSSGEDAVISENEGVPNIDIGPTVNRSGQVNPHLSEHLSHGLQVNLTEMEVRHSICLEAIKIKTANKH